MPPTATATEHRPLTDAERTTLTDLLAREKGTPATRVGEPLRKFCQSQADQCKNNPKRILMIPVADGVSFPIELDGTVGRVLSFIERCLWLILSGFVVGAATGYVSHLALDAVTCKRSLPLLKKGF